MQCKIKNLTYIYTLTPFENAYACCLYICLKDRAHLIYSRGKVASLEKITRTRLELQAVYGGATCADFIWQQIHIKVLAAHAWTERMTELWRQKPAQSWTAWVANRMSSMKHNSNHSSLTWRHCPGFLNPADLPRQGGKMLSRMEQWRLHTESMWTAHKRKWLNSWWSSGRNGCVTCHHFDGKPCAEMTVPLPGSRVNLVHPFYSCGIDYASRRPLLARVPDHGDQCQQVTPAMLMGNFFVSEPRSLEEEQLQSQERTMYQRVMLCCWKKKRSNWLLGFGQEGVSGKR